MSVQNRKSWNCLVLSCMTLHPRRNVSIAECSRSGVFPRWSEFKAKCIRGEGVHPSRVHLIKVNPSWSASEAEGRG